MLAPVPSPAPSARLPPPSRGGETGGIPGGDASLLLMHMRQRVGMELDGFWDCWALLGTRVPSGGLPVAQRVEGVGEPLAVGGAPLPQCRRLVLLPPVVVIAVPSPVVRRRVPGTPDMSGATGAAVACDHGLEALDGVTPSAARGQGRPCSGARGRLPATLGARAVRGSRHRPVRRRSERN
jgi:hypothetical protein